MNLQTKIRLEKQSKNQIDYNSNILLIGSCFSDHIGKKLEYFKFQNLQNPFGILFHPKAIETLISQAIHKKEYSEKDLFFHNEQWHCFDAHSKLSNTSKAEILIQLKKQIEATALQINNATHIFITFGTAWVYKHVETNATVANCHKVPQKNFEKKLLSVDDLYQSLKNVVELIRNVNKNASIIFTVSPVRHLKDGFIENTQSKAHIISAIYQFLNQKSSPDSNRDVNRDAFYFPSFEIMMDELRDYRFYAEDMVHPNQTAINYIWERFKTVWISEEASKTSEEVDAIQKGLQHKPFNESSEAHQNFLQKLEGRKAQLQLQHSHMDFSFK